MVGLDIGVKCKYGLIVRGDTKDSGFVLKTVARTYACLP